MEQLANEEDPRAMRIELKGKIYDRVPYKADEPESVCGDCDAADGEIHELGCDLEDCPCCGGQLITCGCLAPSD